jgi:hypothetical protein
MFFLAAGLHVRRCHPRSALMRISQSQLIGHLSSLNEVLKRFHDCHSASMDRWWCERGCDAKDQKESTTHQAISKTIYSLDACTPSNLFCQLPI